MSPPATPLLSFDGLDFTPAELVGAKQGRHVTVCLPARDEEPTVGSIVRSLVGELQHRHRLVDEVIVIDDGSSDGTAMAARSAGARVLRGAGGDKGGAMQLGVRASLGDVVVFCDADLRCFDASFVVGLVDPLLVDDRLHFVKGG